MIDVLLFIYVGAVTGSWLTWSWHEGAEEWGALTLRQQTLSFIVSSIIFIVPAHYLADWAQSL